MKKAIFIIGIGMLTSTSVINAQAKQDQLEINSTSKVEEDPIKVINRWFF